MLSKTFYDLVRRFEDSVRAYPLSSFASILLTILLFVLSFEPHLSVESKKVIGKIVVLFVFAIPLFVSLKLLKNDNKLSFLGVVFLFLYYCFVFEDRFEIKHFFVFVSFFIMMIWAKFLKDGDNQTIWGWTRQVLESFLASFAIGLVVLGGISLAFFAIHLLFGVDFRDYVYRRLAIVAFVFLSTHLFLSSIATQKVKEYNKYETIFGKYLLVGLSTIYFLILFAYDAKILLTFQMPKGVISWLSIGFSAVAILTYLYLTPYQNSKKKLLWLVVFLQTFMLFYAIGIRIDEYGVTPNRYFVVMFGVWLFVISLYFLLNKRASYKWIFITVSFMAVFSQFGDFSAYSISKTSQIKKLKELIKTYSPLSKDTEDKIKNQISNIYFFLEKNYGNSAIEEAIPSLKGKLGVNSIDIVSKELGFEISRRYSVKSRVRTHIMIDNRYRINPRDVKGFDKYYPNRFLYRFENIQLQDGLKISKNGNFLIFYHDNKKIFEKDLFYLFSKGKQVDQKSMTITLRSEKFYIKIVLLDVDFRDKSVKSLYMDVYVKKLYKSIF